MFDDIVLVKSRTGTKEEFTYDSVPYVVDAKKGIKLPRALAAVAVSQNALRWEPNTGQVIESKVYVEDDKGTDKEMPSTPITAAEIAEVKATDGLGNDTVLINGQVVKKTSINLKPFKEDFTKNNIVI